MYVEILREANENKSYLEPGPDKGAGQPNSRPGRQPVMGATTSLA
jgi:hypothetical protein